MAHRPSRSLKHEYELFVEEEIERYKESVSRSVLLSIGDEAVAVLAGAQQLALTELLLWEEVDRIIRKRLRIPSYDSWRRRRVKVLEELRRPERWGLRPDDALVRTVRPTAEGHVLVAGMALDGQALYLAAHGCAVTAVDREEGTVQRVLDAAGEVGLKERVRACVSDLATWVPDAPLTAVICTASAFANLSKKERARAISALQQATADGGVHLVETLAAERPYISLDELKSRYRGWSISVEGYSGSPNTFLARKEVA
jgi:hypothetical protein